MPCAGSKRRRRTSGVRPIAAVIVVACRCVSGYLSVCCIVCSFALLLFARRASRSVLAASRLRLFASCLDSEKQKGPKQRFGPHNNSSSCVPVVQLVTVGTRAHGHQAPFGPTTGAADRECESARHEFLSRVCAEAA